MKTHILSSLFLTALTTALPTETILTAIRPGRLGAVVSESIECSEIGRSTLARGGNAVDSLISTTLCVGVIGMYHSGIGGGGFLLVRDANGSFKAVDFRETAPKAAFEGMYEGNVVGSVWGGLSVGVPGEIRGLQYVHEKYGSLPWKDLVMPAADLARRGFRVSSDLIRYMNFTLQISPTNFLVNDPVWAEDFAPSGNLITEGETMTRKRYGDTLEKIAHEGPDAFYSGLIAESMVKTIQDSNGTLTLEDLREYQVIAREPLSIKYRNHTLTTIRAPASGAILLSNLATMDQYLDGDKIWKTDRDLSIHRFDEAMRFAYGARMHFGDPAYVDGVQELQTYMLRPETATAIHQRINDTTTYPPSFYDPANLTTTPGAGTSHIVTADHTDLSTTLTTTINLFFGSQLMDPTTGIILNDEMNDFSIPGISNKFGFAPSPSNFIRPGKRPLSSVTPVIVTDASGALRITIGAAGGSRIISSTAQVLWHILEHGMSLAEALKTPRQHDQLLPDVVTFEEGFEEGVVKAMEGRGHQTVRVRKGQSAVQGIRVAEDGVFEAESEPRQKNSAGLTA